MNRWTKWDGSWHLGLPGYELEVYPVGDRWTFDIVQPGYEPIPHGLTYHSAKKAKETAVYVVKRAMEIAVRG